MKVHQMRTVTVNASRMRKPGKTIKRTIGVALCNCKISNKIYYLICFLLNSFRSETTESNRKNVNVGKAATTNTKVSKNNSLRFFRQNVTYKINLILRVAMTSHTLNEITILEKHMNNLSSTETIPFFDMSVLLNR